MMFIYIIFSDISRFMDLVWVRREKKRTLMKIKCQKLLTWKLFLLVLPMKAFQCRSSSLRNENKNIFKSRVWAAKKEKSWKAANGKSILLPLCAFPICCAKNPSAFFSVIGKDFVIARRNKKSFPRGKFCFFLITYQTYQKKSHF